MKKILIVEDSEVIQKLLCNFLQKEGYEVATAENGLVALDILERFKPDIMFIDLIMPIIKGDKLCRIIRKMPEFDATSLVIISAAATETNIDFISLGADACIAKGPLKIMLSNIKEVLDSLRRNSTANLAEKIYGSENIGDREITKELLATQNHLEVIFDNIDSGLVELTDAGKIIFVNKAAINLFSLPEEKLLTAYFPDLFDKRYSKLIAEILENQEGSIGDSGEEKTISLNNKYLFIKAVAFYDVEISYKIVLLQDVTKQKQAESQLKRHEENLENEVRGRTQELEQTNTKLEIALSKVKALSGMLPICASCKKIRDDNGYWNQIEEYIRDHSEAEFTHSICQECAKRLYPDLNFVKNDQLR